MAKHKSKLERYRDICEAVFFSGEKGIKPVPYQVAKEIKYPQSHTTSYMNSLAKKRILKKSKEGIYSIPKFKSLDDFEKTIEKLELSKYYSFKIIEAIKKNLKVSSKVEEVDNFEVREDSYVEKEWFGIKKSKKKLDKKIYQLLEVVDEYPLSFFILPKKSLLYWLEKEIERLGESDNLEEIRDIRNNIDRFIDLVGESTKILVK